MLIILSPSHVRNAKLFRAPIPLRANYVHATADSSEMRVRFPWLTLLISVKLIFPLNCGLPETSLPLLTLLTMIHSLLSMSSALPLEFCVIECYLLSQYSPFGRFPLMVFLFSASSLCLVSVPCYAFNLLGFQTWQKWTFD